MRSPRVAFVPGSARGMGRAMADVLTASERAAFTSQVPLGCFGGWVMP